MANETITASATGPSMQATKVYMMAMIFLVIGLAIGYVTRASRPRELSVPRSAAASSPSSPIAAMASGHMPSPEEMRHMADKQAGPLLEKLKTDPNNAALLAQIGVIYHSTHQFSQAAGFYERAVEIEPKNVALHTKLAISLYRSGDVNGAIAQLNQALHYDPHDANSLFNLGMIRLEGKHDGKGALAAWQKLLKTNPTLSADRKAEVQKLMAEVLTSMGERPATRGEGVHDHH